MACSDEHPAPVRSNVFERTYQAKLAGCRYSGSRASTPESIPLPREKPRKAVASQNALRQAGMSGHEDSGPIWNSHGSQPGRVERLLAIVPRAGEAFGLGHGRRLTKLF
jgi:hypothetical protein